MEEKLKGARAFLTAFFLTAVFLMTLFSMMLSLYRMESKLTENNYTLLSASNNNEEIELIVHNKEFVFREKPEIKTVYDDIMLCAPVSLRCYFDGIALLERSFREIIENI